jgi:hypothetical protein
MIQQPFWLPSALGEGLGVKERSVGDEVEKGGEITRMRQAMH